MTYLIAEIGSNWLVQNGNPVDERNPHVDVRRSHETARALVQAAKDAGADAVKAQMFRAGELYRAGTPEWEAARPYEMWVGMLHDLAGYAQTAGVEFGCSVFSPGAADEVDELVQWHKIASLEMVDVDLVRYVASKRKPILLSTGAATAEEVAVVRGIIEQSWWGAKVCVLQCSAAYPSPVDEVDLLAMPRLGSCYGFSNNSRDWDLSVGAVYMGAQVIEQHIRPAGPAPDPKPPDWDHSLDPSEFAEMVRLIRRAEQARGIPNKYVRPSERALRKWQHAPGGLRGELNG